MTRSHQSLSNFAILTGSDPPLWLGFWVVLKSVSGTGPGLDPARQSDKDNFGSEIQPASSSALSPSTLTTPPRAECQARSTPAISLPVLWVSNRLLPQKLCPRSVNLMPPSQQPYVNAGLRQLSYKEIMCSHQGVHFGSALLYLCSTL